MTLEELERLPIGAAHQRLHPVVDKVRISGEPLVLTHHGRDHVALVPLELLEKLMQNWYIRDTGFEQ